MTLSGDQVIKEAFGASLYDQGRGFYVTLELFALVWGTHAANLGVLPSTKEPLAFHRRGHDFARRLMVSSELLTPEERTHLEGQFTEETLRDLLGSLTVPIPGRRSLPGWGGRHLYPYVGDLIHYDAVERRKDVSLERYTYRGAGGLAHKLLRTDTNAQRIEKTRSGMLDLIRHSDGPLGRLATALTEHDKVTTQTDFQDEPEHESAELPGSHWPELLREGVSNIVQRSNLPRARRVEALMHFVPYCIARHQHARAVTIVGRDASLASPIDCRSNSSPIRDAARAAADEAKGVVFTALERTAREHGEEATKLLSGPQRWRESSRGFYVGTLGSVGALNAMVGKRHFCMRTDLLDSIVLALLTPGTECSFDDFCVEQLYHRMGLIVDARSAGEESTLNGINRAEFQENAEELARSLRELGLLRDFSDATRIVRAEVS